MKDTLNLLAVSAATGALIGTLIVGPPEASATECGQYGTDIYCASELTILPTCTAEDGNPDGLPCIWTDGPTGIRYYVTSENYR